MANMGCIDMNVWYSRVDRPDRPDFVLFDLDPSPDVGFKETIQVALLVKEALDVLGLESFAKTSSADGMHVLVPIERRYTFDDTREFSEIVGAAIARTNRGLATTEWSKAKRRGVLIDSNQNGGGKTIASVYSVRPRPGAPVSTPLRWDEVNETLDPSSFTMDVVLERVRTHGDLFAGVLTTKQRIDRALKALRELCFVTSRPSGWPSVPSSAMSRRKSNEVVQSTTTRSFREKSGSWYRWYERVTNHPGKPRTRTPSTSAIPL
jgi:bifunctional non-homologous end joining protein LigD